MRTILYTFLLAAALLLTPYAVCAGTDDSGLQVFTIDFSKQLGESADIAQEDTLLSSYCYNMFPSGNGMATFPRPKGTGYLFAGASSFSLDAVNLYNSGGTIVRIDGSSTASVYLHYNSGFSPSPLGSQVLLDTNAYNTVNSDIFAFGMGNTQAVFIGTKILYISNVGPNPITSEVILTASGVPMPSMAWKSAAIWQNRLFLTYQNYLYYSAPQNFSDFTSSTTAGGVTRLYESNYISKIVSTKYGLYIFTGDGIWLQSGGASKNSWQIEKIFNFNEASAITKYNDDIFFKASVNESKRIFKISGAIIEPIVEIPQFLEVGYFSENNYTQMSIINSGRFIALATWISGGTSWLYDTQNKTWIRSGEFNGFSDKYFYLKKFSTGYKIYWLPIAQKFYNNYDDDFSLLTPLTPWAYRTSWITLDGNASNRKEIDRVEIDYQGGTTSIGLFYAYGNGYAYFSGINLTAPTNERLSTYVWNAPIGKQQSNRFLLNFLSSGTQTMTTNYILKAARIYYRNIGNYKTNSLR